MRSAVLQLLRVDNSDMPKLVSVAVQPAFCVVSEQHAAITIYLQRNAPLLYFVSQHLLLPLNTLAHNFVYTPLNTI
jgi:hypothetical protein